MKPLLKVSNICFIVLSILVSSRCTEKPAFDTHMLVIKTAAGLDVFIDAELAVTSEQKAQGYMHRKKIPDGSGMLFIYEADQRMSFWMKNTSVPLSIAFISADGEIREIYDMPPLSTATTVSKRSVRYALEVPQGWFDRAGISVGDTVTDIPEK